MDILSVQHKGLKRLLEENDDRGIRREHVDRVRKILSALLSAKDISGIQGPPGWRIHPLTGNREGIWSISISGNWRITFEVKRGTIRDLNLEDYH